MKSRFADPAEDELAEAVEYYQGSFTAWGIGWPRR